MTNRLTLAVAAALLSAAPLLAQAPEQPAEQTLPPLTPVAGPSPAPAVFDGPHAPAPGPGCGDGGCAPGGGQCWVTADYLFGWIQGSGPPALVTTSAPTTDRTVAGTLGPQSATLFGGGVVNDGLRSGMRFQAGGWLDPQRTFGVEAGFMMLESQASLFSASSDGGTILARPFTDATTLQPAANLIAFPGSSAGSVDVRAASGNFYEAHFDFVENIVASSSFRLDGLVGYRFIRYDEALRIDQTILPTGGSFVPGTQVASFDNFGTQNDFHGCDMGLRATFLWDRLTLGLLAKAAVGAMHREVNIAGNTLTSVPGTAPVASTGGLLALSSNVGHLSSHDWGVVPELGCNLKWQVSQYLGLQIGYSAIWLDRVARAADQVDTTVNPTLLPPATAPSGDQRPAVLQQREHIFLQTLNVGVVFTF